ncbi:hypothetical protein UY3_15433 [Chelonia mydas]|uniref:Myb/SANT-like DNA-binding domain-containing protein n=1 Tax=Chelonia mydas TaxID=8469 RepID=M7B5P2_CHEMY|nr:hypothetical protein UY3_15433 [Chelonia mydas]
MQSSSAEVTMMESQNRKRAPAWTEREVRDLIAVWGEESVLSELRSSFRNAKTFVKISQGMKDRGHNRDPKQCRVKLKELRQAYQKTREANGRSGSEPQTCRFYDELHAILGGSATTTPAVLFDSFNGDGGNTEAGFRDKEDEEEVVDSSQQASGETGFPDSQELFLTLDLEPVTPKPTQGCLLDPAGREGTSENFKNWKQNFNEVLVLLMCQYDFDYDSWTDFVFYGIIRNEFDSSHSVISKVNNKIMHTALALESAFSK